MNFLILTKKSILIGIIILSAVLFDSTYSYPFLNEPTGYGGNEWGSDIKTYLTKKSTRLMKKGKFYYTAKMNGVNVDIGYEFFKDKLYGVMITFPPKKRDRIVRYFTLLYGKPTLKRDNNLYWVGVSSKIEISRKVAEIVSVKLEKEYFKERAKGNNTKSRSNE